MYILSYRISSNLYILVEMRMITRHSQAVSSFGPGSNSNELRNEFQTPFINYVVLEGHRSGFLYYFNTFITISVKSYNSHL